MIDIGFSIIFLEGSKELKNRDEIRSSIIHNIQDFQTLISSASVTQIKRCCAKKNEGTGLVPIQSRFCQLEDWPLTFVSFRIWKVWKGPNTWGFEYAALGQSYVPK